MTDEYVDVLAIHPGWVEKTCWNCLHTWHRQSRRAESICRECFMGQGDHPDLDEPTDYGELWYGDIPLEEKRAEYQEMRDELNDGVLSNRVEVPMAGRGPALATVMRVDDGDE